MPSDDGRNMLFQHRLRNHALRWWRGRKAPIFYHPDYRLPLPTASAQLGIDARRADLALWTLLDLRLIDPGSVVTPHRIRYVDVARVHTPALLESLHDPQTLARIFAADPHEIPIDQIMVTFRLACGGTLAAAREALKRGGPAFNLLGGFHHAEPDKAGGLCPVNDIAIAVAALRADGFAGRVAILDLDAHPPDGTAACLAGDDHVWIGSLSGSDWGPLPAGVDETVLPVGTGDEAYLRALGGLLDRMPRSELFFVLAGNDVLAGDRMGKLGLSVEGARRRDAAVALKLAGRPSVWVPAGGYHPRAWEVLTGTVMAVETGSLEPLPEGFDPLRARFSRIARSMHPEALEGEDWIREEDLQDLFGVTGAARSRLLGYYTADGLEYALFRYGVLDQLRRLGYEGFRVELNADGTGDRMRVYADAAASEVMTPPPYLLVELVVERIQLAGRPVLFIHWLSLTHPLAQFDAARPKLPGQEQPGLGLARESGEMLIRMAQRLSLEGVAFRPAWFHIAYAGRHQSSFVEPDRQGRFEALIRDLAALPLLEATQAVAQGRVRLNGEPYTWEADHMVRWLTPFTSDEAAIRRERERAHFTVDPA